MATRIKLCFGMLCYVALYEFIDVSEVLSASNVRAML
jgi:hypothetical protein